MRFAICNELFAGWPLARVMQHVARLGYRGLELAPFTFGAPVRELGPVWRREMRLEARRVGLRLVGLHRLLAGTQGLHLSHPDLAVRRRTAAHLAALGELCADLGGRVLVLGSPAERRVLPGCTVQDAWRYTQDTVIRCLPHLYEAGVLLCLEPLGREETDLVNTVAEGIRFLEELDHPALRLQLDVKAMQSEGGSIPDLIAQAAPYVAHVHASDGRAAPGFGSLDFAPILGALRAIGYRGYVSVEAFDTAPGPQAIAERSLACLRAALARAGTAPPTAS